MKRMINILMLIAAMLTLQACNDGISRKTGGKAIGGVTGALIGSQFSSGSGQIVAVAIGSLAGSMLGEHIAERLDQRDAELLKNSSKQALEYAPSGRTTEWKNPDTGNSGTITPVKTYKEHQHYCREYIQEIFINGKKQKAYGRACRQPDGEWQIVQ